MCRGVLCLVDRDYEDCCPNVKPNSYLVFTDVNSLEAYALFPSVVEKFLLVALGGFPLSKRTVMDVIDRILTRLYAIRVTNERLGWGMSWIPFTRYVSLTKESIALREADFLRSYLQKNHRWDSSKEFAAALSETTAQLPTDIGRRIRGHDLADLMLLLVNRFRKERKFGNVETIEGSLLATIEAADLDDSVLFRRIVALGQEGQG